jgi:hypothetical protein
VYVKRGPLPLSDEDRLFLEEPRKVSGEKYKIFEHTEPTGTLSAALWKRGVRRKRSDEWMAIMVTRVKDHRRGPDDAPYIPSTRKSEKHDKVVG